MLQLDELNGLILEPDTAGKNRSQIRSRFLRLSSQLRAHFRE